ncbi:MAG: adenylyltransferase/cytidyltransferase family protein, partial [Pseudomonas sp.]|nr:adenylyltransferase/cytidyltransferase family protein [Pseudomonas sp.]
MVKLKASAPAPVIDVLPQRIGVLGGTFDPVHIGHLRGGLEVAEMMGLDELRLTPNARTPHRDTPQVSAHDRLAMVECAV